MHVPLRYARIRERYMEIKMDRRWIQKPAKRRMAVIDVYCLERIP